MTLHCGPEEDKTPLPIRLIDAVKSLQPSVELVRQFGAKGKVAGHGNPDWVALMPRYWRLRQSAHPLVSGIMFLTTQLARLGE